MAKERNQLVAALKEEIGQLRRTMDELHREEAEILSMVDSLVRKAQNLESADFSHAIMNAYSRIVASGSALAAASLELQIPPTVYEPYLKPLREEPKEEDKK